MREHMTYEFVNYFQNVPLYCSIVGISDFNLHWHKDIEILFVLKGRLCLYVNNTEYILEPGEILLINSNVSHLFQDIGDDNLTFLLQFNPDLIKFNSKDGKPRGIHFNCNSKELDVTFDKALGHLRQMLAVMGLETLSKRSGYEYMIQAKIYEVIATLFRDFTYEILDNIEETEKINKSLDRAKKIIQYIDEHYCDELTVNDVAQAVYMSSSYFSHFFKDFFGVAFSRYLDTLRLNKSAYLLKSTNRSIMDIAINCGFNSDQSMYRLYQKRMKMTPTQYRKDYANDRQNEMNYLGYKIVNPIAAVKYLTEYVD